MNVSRQMCRKGRVTTHASEPLKRNLFLQSLNEEEQESVNKANDLDNLNNNSQAEIQDKDIVECLESDVQYWTDFSKVHYHPQSLYELSGLWTDIQDFDNYGLGKEAFCGHQHGEEIDDRLRFFIEECDHIQVLSIEISRLRFCLVGLLLFINPFSFVGRSAT